MSVIKTRTVVKAFLIFDNTGFNYYYNQLEPFSYTNIDLNTENNDMVTALLSAIKIFAQSIFNEDIRQVVLDSHFIVFYNRKINWDERTRLYFAIIGEKTIESVNLKQVVVNDICFKIYDKFCSIEESRTVPRSHYIHNQEFDDFVNLTLANVCIIF